MGRSSDARSAGEGRPIVIGCGLNVNQQMIDAPPEILGTMTHDTYIRIYLPLYPADK